METINYINKYHFTTYYIKDTKVINMQDISLINVQDTNIISLFVKDHERITSLLNDFDIIQKNEPKKALGILKQLNQTLTVHFHQEEILYSNYKNAAGEIIPVMQTIRKEHEIILKKIEKATNSLNKGSGIDTTSLLSLLERHKNIEQGLLYPELDRVLSEKDKEDVYWKIKVN